MKRENRREFLFSSILTAGILGCNGYGNNPRLENKLSYQYDESKIRDLEEIKSGIIISSGKGESERNHRVLEVKVISDNGEEHYTISIKANKSGNSNLSLNLLGDNCIGDVINFPTKMVSFNDKTGEYLAKEYFKDGSTYAVIDIDKISFCYNPERDEYRANIKKR